jgi:hypothetical protein
VRSAHELHQAGLEALVGRRLGVARRLLDRAREAAVEPDLVARIEASRAYLIVELGDLTGALQVCDAALAMPGVTPETSGVLYSQRALILLRRGQTVDALDAFGVGVGMLTDPVERGKALSNRGLRGGRAPVPRVRPPRRGRDGRAQPRVRRSPAG